MYRIHQVWLVSPSFRTMFPLLVFCLAVLDTANYSDKCEPKFEAAFLVFAYTAEIWNTRACMIGLIGTFIILNKGILEIIGVDVGKELDHLPL
ncbi:hypothetical protein HID58_003613 [Brassica napus]|uniref:Uncharacterized protein n=1 Tax=Brassica napus TaxID=3708 RepID=A0ABQ8EQW8_BRANA|nr:hypothetical protein HID58_003613 [Brassica napus]